MSGLSDSTDRPVGESIEHAVLAITRWASRPEIRRRMLAEGNQSFSSTDTWLLHHLVEDGSTRMRELAEWQGVDKSTITAQINRLQSRGLVTRVSDPTDRRAVLVSATSHAREIVANNSTTSRALLDDLVASWSARDRATLSRLLDRLVTELIRGRAPE